MSVTNFDYVQSIAHQHTHSNTALVLLRDMYVHSPETYTHTINVCSIAYKFGRFLDFSTKKLELLFDAALVHDIGKLQTPKEILHKQGALQPIERQVMNDHVKHCYGMLAGYSELESAVMIGCLHHERWDGNGYPFRLKGNEIPFIAQVLAIVDTWDAMVSDRSYRKGMPYSKAISILLKEKHMGQFNPILLEWFIAFVEVTSHHETKKC